MNATRMSESTPSVPAHRPRTDREAVLEVKDLRVHYRSTKGDVIAVNGISFQLLRGETLGLVGESGCGKTTSAMAILRLVQPPGEIVHGEVWLNGKDLASLSETELRKVRWQDISLIPQGAMNSLNPVMRVKDQIADGIRFHEGRLPESERKQRILELFSMVGLPDRVYSMYPHELSGGMKQRVCIAMAIALNPSVIIADEPTSALDVVVQRVVTQTLLEVKARLGLSMLLIGHDMGLQAQLVDRIAVMYAGNVVEIGWVEDIYEKPMHPYTQMLIASIPSIREKKPLQVTEGLTHDLRKPPPGCSFQYRCPHVMEVCRQQPPPLVNRGEGQSAACHLYS